MIKRVNDDDILDINNLIQKYDKRVAEGDDTPLTTDPKILKEEKKTVKTNTRNSKYSGPLKLYLDEFEIDEYGEDIIEFKEFFDSLGDDGVTYEDLFDRIEKYNEETGMDDITVSKTKSKLYQMNALNTISLATIRDISHVLGYELKFKFRPILTDEIFESTKSLKDI